MPEIMDDSLADKAAEAAANPKVEETTEEQADKPQFVEIDGLDKVVFRGKEYTPEDFDKAMLRQSDYTRKTQELAKQRKYIDNLTVDLESVKHNPELAARFKEVYPEEFHAFLNAVMNTGGQDATDHDTESYEDLTPKQIRALVKAEADRLVEEKLKPFNEKVHSEKVEAAYSQLDVILSKLGQKYDMAVEDTILNRAQQLLDENKDNADFKMTEAAWEKLFRVDHEKREKAFNERQKRLLTKQTQTGERATDGGPGGIAPGRPAKKMSFDDVTEMLIQDLSR